MVKRKNSKAIGSDYEREIAKKLSTWLTGDEKADLVCWRQSHSGSVATNRKKKGLEGETTSGDFQCLDSKYEEFFKTFNCDSKSLGSVHLMMINPKNMKSNQLLNEWKKVCKDSESSGKIPLMFVKARNDKKIPDLVIMPTGMYCDGDPFILFRFEDLDGFVILLQERFFFCNQWEDLVKFNT